jgi:hypothetical protein
MDYPDESLSESQMSLQQFVWTARYILSQEQNSEETLLRFIRFVLAGRFEFNDDQIRIFVNARQGAPPPSFRDYHLRRDIDSAFGVTRDLPFRVALAIFPLASFRDTLTKDIHMKYKPNALSGSQVQIYMQSSAFLNCS